jgi:hypothetical protein
MILVLLLAISLSSSLPIDIPKSTDSWEEVTGDIDICTHKEEIAVCEGEERTDVELSYSMRIDPDRPALYALTRYRYATLNPKVGKRFSNAERIQWIPREKEVHAYEKIWPQKGLSGKQINYWRELDLESKEYRQFFFEIMLLYNIHRAIAEDRE